jgi:hypothetical protein
MDEAHDEESLDFLELQIRLRTFAADREWDQFHTPKNLAMALAGKAVCSCQEHLSGTPDARFTGLLRLLPGRWVKGLLPLSH